jgi:hypothetical protein
MIYQFLTDISEELCVVSEGYYSSSQKMRAISLAGKYGAQ